MKDFEWKMDRFLDNMLSTLNEAVCFYNDLMELNFNVHYELEEELREKMPSLMARHCKQKAGHLMVQLSYLSGRKLSTMETIDTTFKIIQELANHLNTRELEEKFVNNEGIKFKTYKDATTAQQREVIKIVKKYIFDILKRFFDLNEEELERLDVCFENRVEGRYYRERVH